MPLTLIQLLPFTKLTFSSPAVYLLCFLIGSKNRQGRKTSFIGLLKLHQSMHLSPSLSFFFFFVCFSSGNMLMRRRHCGKAGSPFSTQEVS